MRITLCGSTRFMDKFREWNRVLTNVGHIVYSSGFVTDSDELPSKGIKEIPDLVRLMKILDSDAVLVIASETHLGFSTKREIAWAKMNGKKVFYEETDGAALRNPPLAPIEEGAI